MRPRTNPNPLNRAAGAVFATLAAALVLVAGSPTNADTPTGSAESVGEPGTSAPDYLARLHALVGKQTAEEIATIEHGGGPAELLVDPETGEVIAALKTGPSLLTQFSVD
ncbi:hypothetical protein ACFOYW_13765 [Gryllotalpicola reticulitermitis]|uniref:Uncharacterized protein n=1 Tax=Gryllotalpicola reticulitermitis TaxID=1184153 RepID=A0ABV8QAV0_9MICO